MSLRKQIITQKLLKLKRVTNKHDKYITTSEYNKLTAENFFCKIKTRKFSNKSRF